MNNMLHLQPIPTSILGLSNIEIEDAAMDSSGELYYQSQKLSSDNYNCRSPTTIILRTTQKIKTGYNALCLATQYRTINANIIQSI